MGRVIFSEEVDTNDTGYKSMVDVSDYDMISVQLRDTGGVIGSGVIDIKCSVDGEIYNAFATPVQITSTASTHWQTGINVEHSAFVGIEVSTAAGTDSTVYLTVFGYNVDR